MMVWLTPSMIEGFAIGSCTLRRVWRVVDPNESATSRVVAAMPRIPRLVSRTAGGSAKMTVEIRAVAAPIPKKSTSGRRYEYAGIVCIASRIGRKIPSTRARRPAQIPSGIPIRSAIVTATIMSESVSMLCSHSPRTPMTVKPAAERAAIRHPATTAAIEAAATITPT